MSQKDCNKRYKERLIQQGLCSVCSKESINYNRSEWKCNKCLNRNKKYKKK